MLAVVARFVNGVSGQARLDHADEGGMMGASRLSVVTGGLNVAEESHPMQSLAEQVHTELHRIMDSAHFDASERNRRFLGYVVEETLMGRGERIKAYTIATMVFGRDDGFDPTLDPVVRMEARRLRRSLERFYLFEGEEGAIRIALPKGGYVPQFPPTGTLGLNGEPARSDDGGFNVCGPSIFVSSFELEYSHREDLRFCDGLARQIVIALSHLPGLTIFMPCPRNGIESSSSPSAGIPAIDFFLAGNVVAGQDILKVKITLLDARTGRVVQAETFAGDTLTNDFLEERDRIADEIARHLSGCITADRIAFCR